MTTLVTDRLRLTVDAAFGARVTTLTDRASGRQWLVDGPAVAADSYGPAQAVGWDECFPTVVPCRSAPRDHGDLWGRPAAVTADAGMIRAEWHGADWTFARTLRLTGPAELAVDYAVTHHGAAPLAWMWSQHCLIAPRPGDRIALAGITGCVSGKTAFDWPHLDGRDLSVVPTQGGWAVKAYAQAGAQARATVTGTDGHGLQMDWSGADCPSAGLWLSHGGWNGCHQIAIEPTTAPVDDLDTATARGLAARIPPHGTAHWSVTLRLTGPATDPIQVTK